MAGVLDIKNLISCINEEAKKIEEINEKRNKYRFGKPRDTEESDTEEHEAEDSDINTSETEDSGIEISEAENSDIKTSETKGSNKKKKTIVTDSDREATLIHLNQMVEDCKYSVRVYEDIDIREATALKKFFIRITGKNKSYVDIDFFEYKKICLDYGQDEFEFIRKNIEKLAGVMEKEDEQAVVHIVAYLSRAMHRKREHVKLYSELGWSQYDGKEIFKYDGIYSSGGSVKGVCKSSIREELSLEDPYGFGRDKWALRLIHIMNHSVLASIVISASISGIFRQMLPYTKETNINMNIVGESAMGKSTICHFALSFFGNPEILEGSFTDSDNAMEIIRAERTVIPYVLDERMLKMEGASEATRKRNVLMDIFREYEGKVKERMGKQYEGVSGKRTYSPIISSSVESMLNMVLNYSNLGQFRRFMEFSVDSNTPLFEDGKEAELAEETAYTYYGFGINMLMEYLFKNKMEDGEEINKRFEETNEIVKERIERAESLHKLNGIKASSQRFALIIMSYITLCEVLEDAMPDESIDNKTQDIIQMLISNAVDKMKKVKKRIEVRKNILGFINNHKGLFYQESKLWDGKGEYLGQLEETDEEYQIYIRKNSYVWWIMSSPMQYDEKDLRKYIKTFIDNGYKGMTKKAEDLAGSMPEKDIKKYFFKYDEGITVTEKKVSAVRFDVVIVSKKDFDATDKSDPEEE